jgi:hypothetical protein
MGGSPATRVDWTTAVSVLETRSGILLLPAGRRHDELNASFDIVLEQVLDGRVLPFDAQAAEQSARIVSARITQGRNIGSRDAQIAGIVLSRKAQLATRNIKDFAGLDMALVNPWEADL